MRFILLAHKSQGVLFLGIPEYIHTDAWLDPSGGLTIGDGVVISTKVIVLTHDWSFLKRQNYDGSAYKAVVIGRNSFIGAGAILLPGTSVGCNCIIGAGTVVKGKIDDYSIVVGNQCRIIGSTAPPIIDR